MRIKDFFNNIYVNDMAENSICSIEENDLNYGFFALNKQHSMAYYLKTDKRIENLINFGNRETIPNFYFSDLKLLFSQKESEFKLSDDGIQVGNIFVKDIKENKSFKFFEFADDVLGFRLSRNIFKDILSKIEDDDIVCIEQLGGRLLFYTPNKEIFNIKLNDKFWHNKNDENGNNKFMRRYDGNGTWIDMSVHRNIRGSLLKKLNRFIKNIEMIDIFFYENFLSVEFDNVRILIGIYNLGEI